MVGRKYTATTGAGYRFGFNGKERASEINSDDYDFGARVYDGRLGRWLSVDGYSKAYPSHSPYLYGLNCPNLLKDEGGNWITDKDGNPIYTTQGTSLSKHGENYYLVENRTYFTNDGKEVKATKYLSMLKKGDYTENGKTINYEAKNLMDIPKENLDNTYDCHGNTCFKDKYVYIPGSDTKNAGKYDKNPDNIFRNSDEYESVSEENLREGDIALFGAPPVKDPRGFGYGNKSEEMINHSATYNGNKTYTSKDDRKPLNTKATVESMSNDWGELLGYVRFKGNLNGNVESLKDSKTGLSTGEVTPNQVKEAIKFIKAAIEAEKKAKKEAKKAAKAAKKAAKSED
jgi:RHS repeat-associated protein